MILIITQILVSFIPCFAVLVFLLTEFKNDENCQIVNLIMINLYIMLECFNKRPIVLFAFKPNLVLISGTLVVLPL